MRRLLAGSVAVGLALVLGACDGGGEDDRAGSVPTAAAPTPTPRPAGWPNLITQSSPTVGGLDAIVGGVLRVNREGCVTLEPAPGESYVLLAPYGSEVTGDGRTFELAGMGTFRVGDRVRGAGGYADGVPRRNVPDRFQPCLPEKGSINWVSIRAIDR